MAIKSFRLILGILFVLSLALCGCSRQGDKASSAATDQLARDFVAAWNSHDPDRLVALFTDDCIYEDVPAGKVSHGKEELRPFFKEILEGFPDFRMELRSVTASGDHLAMEWTMNGTQTGKFSNLPATGKSFYVPGVSVSELKGEKIQRNADYYDAATVLRQLGIQPQTATADPFAGTWKMNVTKSTPDVPLKSLIVKIEPQSDIFKWTYDGVLVDGKVTHIEWLGKYDGNDYPLKGSSELDPDASAVKRIDAKTIRWIDKKAGKDVATWQFTVSNDGKTQSWTGKVKDAKGQEIKSSAFFEKQ